MAAPAKKKSGIHIKPSHKGLLHEDLGIPEGEPIPMSRIRSAMRNAGPKLKKRLVFAENAKTKFNK
jgi:hypothetical protein